jgi:hypothetical protein
MSDSKNPPAGQQKKFSLRTREADHALLQPGAKRFDIFLVDTGWNREVSKVVQSHLETMYAIQCDDSFFVLTPEQSAELMRQAPRLIGHDPILLVYDLLAPPGKKARGYRGFRLNLGLIKRPDQAMIRLQEFLRFMAMNRKSGSLNRAITRELHREGLDGLVKIIREASTELI